MSAAREQIAALSTMKDSQRLVLLKEVGGTKIYEERRHDSLKLMAESEGRSQRIQEVVRGAHFSFWAEFPAACSNEACAGCA